MDDERPQKRKAPAPLTEESLERAALGYLERFDATAWTLRRVLLRRVLRARRDGDPRAPEGEAMVDRLIERYRGSGLVSDVRYAATMARGLRERGGSMRAIRQKLRERGVSDEDMSAALESAGMADGDGELDAARTFARKRRLGPFGAPEERAENLRRDLARMARAGFGFDVCRRVLDSDVDEPLDY